MHVGRVRGPAGLQLPRQIWPVATLMCTLQVDLIQGMRLDGDEPQAITAAGIRTPRGPGGQERAAQAKAGLEDHEAASPGPPFGQAIAAQQLARDRINANGRVGATMALGARRGRVAEVEPVRFNRAQAHGLRPARPARWASHSSNPARTAVRAR